MTSCEECQKPLGTSPDGGAWCVNEKCSRVYRAADPTPPAAPRPCGCGHARSDHEELEADGLEVCAGDNESCRCMEYRPVSPEAARFARSPWKLDDGSRIQLITPAELATLAPGTVLRCIDGINVVVGKDTIDDDTRYGYLAFGFDDPPVAAPNTSRCLKCSELYRYDHDELTRACGCGMVERGRNGLYPEAAPSRAPVEHMPKLVKSAPPVGEPLTCPHGTWTRAHAIRCMACFPTLPAEAAPPRATTARVQVPNAPPVDPPIPHCPYCGKLSSSVAGAYAEPRCDHRCRERAEPMSNERLAEIRKRVTVLPAWELVELLTEVDRLRASLAPSRDSGALLDVGALLTKLDDADSFDERSAILRAALDRHLSTLERDAARMRTDVQRAFETADALANALTQDSDSGDFGRALADRAHTACKLFGQLARIRAALSPSGEPTATPET
jgi:hypothetical protein